MENKFLNFIGIISVAAAMIFVARLPKEEIMQPGIDIHNMDIAVRPGDDFYDYATRGWRTTNPIPDDYSRYGAIEALHNTNLARVREIAENDNGKIGTLYRVAMDAEKLNADGTTPVHPQFAEIDTIKSADDLPQYLGKMHRFSTAFWGDGVVLDEMDSEHFLYNIAQAGLGMARDYYFDTDAKSVEIREKYRKYIAAQLKNFGINADADKIYTLEERMAKSFYPKEKLRDPHANYHKMSISEIKSKFPQFDWDTYLNS